MDVAIIVLAITVTAIKLIYSTLTQVIIHAMIMKDVSRNRF